MSSGRAPDVRRRVMAIVGPTAVGKTAVALMVAEGLDGEIVSADSRQIYRRMDIGTAKPTADELTRVRHHLIDVIEPSDTYDAVRFAREAEAVISELLARSVEPLVVGGTGFYMTSLFEGLFEGPGRDEEVRAILKERSEREGTEELHRELASIDPESASAIHRNDASRVIRALEVHATSGRTLSEWKRERPREPMYRAEYFGLTMPRGELYERIDARVDAMMQSGLLDEVRRLVADGALAPDMPAASAVGYRELLEVVSGRTDDLTSAVERIKRNTRRYAKRQLTWFGSVPDVHWIDVGEKTPEEAAEEILTAYCT